MVNHSHPATQLFIDQWSHSNDFFAQIRAIGIAQTYIDDCRAINQLCSSNMGELHLSELQRLVVEAEFGLGDRYQNYCKDYQRLCKKIRRWWHRERPNDIGWHRMEAAIRKAWGYSPYNLVVAKGDYDRFIMETTIVGEK